MARQLFVAGAMEDGDGVRKQFRDGVERFYGAARAAGEIHKDGLAADGGDSA